MNDKIILKEYPMVRFFFPRMAVAIFLIFILTTPALAHKVNIIAYAEDGFIHTESSFGTHHPVITGIVEVRDAVSNDLILTGTTDNKGKWSFPITKKLFKMNSDLNLIIKAGEGHQGKVHMPATQYRAAILY